MIRLSFYLRVAKVTIVIHLVFLVGSCAILMRLAFRDHELSFLWLAIVNRLGDCDWFVFGNAILIRRALCDCDLLAAWLAIFTCFLCCDSNLPVTSGKTAIRLLLRNADSFGWFDCLLVDKNYFQCVGDS